LKKLFIVISILVLLVFQSVSARKEIKDETLVTFSDSHLEQQVKNNLGVSKVTEANILSLRTIEVFSVDSLNGLEFAKNIEEVEINDSKIDLSLLNHLPKLNKLIIKDSNINLYDISQAITLQTLTIENCGVSDLFGISGLTNLKNLSLKNNYIHSLLPIINLSSLETINLESNYLTDLYDLLTLNQLGAFSTTASSIDIRDNYLDTTTGSVIEYNLKLLESQGIQVKYSNQNKKQVVDEIIIKQKDSLYSLPLSKYIHAKASNTHIFEGKDEFDLKYIKSEDEFYEFLEYKESKEQMKDILYKTIGFLKRKGKEKLISCNPYNFN